MNFSIFKSYLDVISGKYEEPVKNAEIQRNVLILAEIEKVIII